MDDLHHHLFRTVVERKGVVIYFFQDGDGWDKEWALIRATSKEEACEVAKRNRVFCQPDQLTELPEGGQVGVIWHLESPGPVSS